MDLVGSIASIVQLAQNAVKVCIKVRRTYKSVQGFTSTFDAAILDAEIGVQRFVLWHGSVKVGSCATSVREIIDRVLENIAVEIKKIDEYVTTYAPESDVRLAAKLEKSNDSKKNNMLPHGTTLFGNNASEIQAQTSGNSAAKSPSLLKRFQYALLHEKEIVKHTARLEKSVSQLYALIPAEGQSRLDLQLQAFLLDSNDAEDLLIISKSAGSHDLKSIESSSRVKAARIKSDKTHWVVDGKNTDLECESTHFSLQEKWDQKEIGLYKGKKVLIEWKQLSNELSAEESTTRIVDIAGLLHIANTSRPKDLITFDCLGYMRQVSLNSSIGLVYALPTLPHQSRPQSMHELLSQKSDQQTFGPPLERRRQLAIALARAVFQLHVVGWLHKGIRPQNVIILGNASNLRSPYLIGFDYARRGDESAMTELPDQKHDLYRHPSAQGYARSRFQPTFDLFALGLILLEIGIWDPLSTRLKHYARELKLSDAEAQSRFHSRLMQGGNAMKELPFHMGTGYLEAVKICLTVQQEDLDNDVYILDIIGNLETAGQI